MSPFQKDERFFTKDWTITLPSRPEPNLKFIRLTPNETAEFKRFVEEADSSPAAKSSNTEPSPVELKASFDSGDRMQKMYVESQTQHHAFDVFISLDDKFVGSGAIYEITPPFSKLSVANIGIKLHPEVQGKGLGKTLMQLLLRLSNEVDADIIEAGTMKENASMRAMAKSVGLVESDKIKFVPGRGVVADVMFENIERERWRDFEMVVEFREKVVELQVSQLNTPLLDN
ncbi:hypothetical protein HYFRA_00007690 [Hymenoscyphus fraxineus]|uniref:N-acetyltransferase domain-containing protein n=1 Tax=Hymenoscyphus fraxineus TaxID=746836 RepID=A0A9N9PMZ5_9HELO|nr:hypothetical protein HYFRA_00007690 [Hymenoscyphus fraxineus]